MKEFKKPRYISNDIRSVQLAYFSAFAHLVNYEDDVDRFLERACRLVDKYRIDAMNATKNGPSKLMADVYNRLKDIVS